MKNVNKSFIIFIMLLFVVSASLSYAYFSTTVKGNEKAKDVVVETGTLKLVYTDSPEIVAEHIKPGWSTTKVVTVKNTGTLDTAYNLVWQELTNEITNNELVISASCERINSSNMVEGTCESITESSVGNKKIKKNISIESGITHKYTFTIRFKEMNSLQDYNQNKKFNGVIGVNEYKTIPEHDNFSTDSWETIAEAVINNNISNYSIGDTKEVDVGTYGTHTLRIANTSKPSECDTDGFSETACGFVLEFQDIVTRHNINRNSIGGWAASSMRTFVNNDIYNLLPEDLKNIIIDTTVVSSHNKNETENFTSIDKLYLLSPKEVYQDFDSVYDSSRNLTRTLDYYKSIGVTMDNCTGAGKSSSNPTVTSWGLRSATSEQFANQFYTIIYNTGKLESGHSNNNVDVSPAFRIG